MRSPLLLRALLLISAPLLGASTCPSAVGKICSHHGQCNSGYKTTCTCFVGWTGGACELRTCPKDKAWSDIATATDVAHGDAECSNRGHCDRLTGQCACAAGFTGKACQRTKCPNDCMLQGSCISMRHHAFATDMTKQYVTPWDSTKMYGCLCDSGFTGADCSLRLCPTGDDPLTSTVMGTMTAQANEIQVFKCTATGGSFRLSFMGKYTPSMPYDVVAATLRASLESLPGIYVEPGLVSVAIIYSTGTTACLAAGTNTITIEFKQNFGDVPKLGVLATGLTGADVPWESAYDGVTLNGVASVKGTKENEPCSNRGTCDATTGVCECFVDFITSNGAGGTGVRGDCGVQSRTIAACPGVVQCSGHGFCTELPEYKCMCNRGWTSGDCSLKECPKGKAWFGLPAAQDVAHSHVMLDHVECSNAGLCETKTGICECMDGFEGAACSRMKCPGDLGDAIKCSGHGNCMTMGQLAEVGGLGVSTYAGSPVTYGVSPGDPLRWDFDMIMGCACDTGFHGFDCTLMSCPTGDDPHTIGVWERQLLHCNATSGSFKLIFGRENAIAATTAAISFAADSTTVKSALEALDTIGTVDVRTLDTTTGLEEATGTAICSSNGQRVVEVTFKTEFGILPRLHPFDSGDLFNSVTNYGATVGVVSGGDAVGLVASVLGTKEDAVCSNRGKCDEATGQCLCYEGFGSSDGNGASGVRADCGYVLPFIPMAAE